MVSWDEILARLPSEVREVIETTRAHNRWRRETINLIASENVMSPLAEAAYLNDMMHRYAEGKPRKRYYQGLRYVDVVEELVMKYMGELLGGAFIEPRPVSGTIANATVFRALASCPSSEGRPKALIAPVQAGAHVSHTKFGTLGALCIEHIELPYDPDNLNVDVDKAVKMIEDVKPVFVVLGGSLYLFPHPVREIAEAAHSVGAKLVYDAAHVLGLIVGKRWRNPLDHGADIMTASTHKTFPGPQGGIIATRQEDLYKAVSRIVFPYFVSNHHLHRLPALAITALEMKYYGEAYADQVVRNAKALAEALAAEGFKVLGEHLGYTRSHQVAVDVREYGGGAKAAQLLEEANIIVNKNLLPYDPPDAIKNPSGLRLGVQEMTRWGMKEDDMREIARFMRRVVIDGEDPAKVRKEVVEFRRNFQKVHYAFDVDPTENGKLLLLY
ncbi:Glycine hydroxymethyltransferase [Pyrolobus fumarii 1A]|uniref:Serine hydroxymethyltransferase n=1 Tax=Pyrolobus fumarii (strain DSM 11204 / 1A) TaxID=694429 RepID=G0EHK4_PYRF1|nr:serine hydroxymethyltransferase [Pyrolobus fumarii]AEM39357.1 Glycine hydroxymethyltransferase [Pyrolobus fumarii 1A]